VALIEKLERLLASGQDNALLRYGLGNEYLKAGRFDNATEHLRQAVAHDPGYSAAWKLLGQALAAAGRTDDAIQAYENGMRAAGEKGDLQAAKEMTVFLKRLQKP
jgi:predicted Zn-dependent protease